MQAQTLPNTAPPIGKNSNDNKTKKTQMVTKIKNPNCDSSEKQRGFFSAYFFFFR